LSEILLIAEAAEVVKTELGRQMMTDLLDRVREQRTLVNTAHRRHVRALEHARTTTPA
jgi:hypothetical protein